MAGGQFFPDNKNCENGTPVPPASSKEKKNMVYSHFIVEFMKNANSVMGIKSHFLH